VEAALEARVPIDVSSGPALWGGQMRGADATLLTVANPVEDAGDERSAADLAQAHLLQTLCALGRDSLDFYFLRVRSALPDYAIGGFMQAMEMAREEGMLRFLGICADGPVDDVRRVWQPYDAFEAVLLPRNHRDARLYDELEPLARSRRVGVATYRTLEWGFGLSFDTLLASARVDDPELATAVVADLAADHPVVVSVRTPEEVRRAVAAAGRPRPERIRDALAPLVDAFESDAVWRDLEGRGTASERRAADRRRREAEARP
jgi:hypothetical protein